MTNEEIVLNKINNGRLSKIPIRFGLSSRDNYMFYSDADYNLIKTKFKENEDSLKEKTNVIDRVYKIIRMADSYRTYHINGRFQCGACCRRSTADIWRIYKYYFGDIDIFTIMRTLYKLVDSGDLNTYRCPDIRKRVFWYDNYYEKNYDMPAEIGVPFSEWKNIGLNGG